MQAEVIVIGDEILIGQVTDTNSGFIARELLRIGIPVNRITTVSDEKQSILSALKETSERSELILITGGLGPTRDDITKQTICEFFDTKLILDNEVLDHVKLLFSSRNLKMPGINIKQAEVPEKCIPVKNHFGTAPGMWFETPNNPPKGGISDLPSVRVGNVDSRVFIFMPGVPYEMEAMMKNEILPKLRTKFDTPVIVQKTILTHGVGESMLMEIIHDWEEDLYKKGMKLAYLPSFGTVRLRITIGGKNKSPLEEALNNKIAELKKMIPRYFSGEEGEKPEEIIGKLLRDKKQTLSTAESCTGGYMAHLITNIPGCSDYYKGSVISYSNESKEKELQVSKSNLEKYGAVSKEVVEAMAMGVKNKFNTDFAIAASGIAGPTGGNMEKPVGTVWIAVASPKNVISKKYLFTKSREVNIKKATAQAFILLLEEMGKTHPDKNE